jgi:transcriptional regulator with XRE-family HTH domain
MPNDSLFAYVLGRLGASKGKWRVVAKHSGVSYRTVEKIARGEIRDPGISHIEKLANYFRKKEKEDAA